ncbi:MAG: integrase [Methylophilaceae bacterium]|jgi:integrase
MYGSADTKLTVRQRITTNERNEAKARVKAKDLMVEAEIRRRANIPAITRYFRDMARFAIEKMNKTIANDKATGSVTRGSTTYKDYIDVINNYLVPCLGKLIIANIDVAALTKLETFRNAKMKKTPTRSTLLTHNAALNRVFDEAENRGFLTKSTRPKLVAIGAKSERRAAFALEEIHVLLDKFEAWIGRGRTAKSKALRFVLYQYVKVLLDTGARPGNELLNLRWNQLTVKNTPITEDTGISSNQNLGDVEPELITSTKLQRSAKVTVTGKTGTREIVGMTRTVNALAALGKRNYAVDMPIIYPLINIATASNSDLVFTIGNNKRPTSLNALFESFLEEHSLLTDPVTTKKRVLYSLRHSYATLSLVHDLVPIHTLSKQMGTSIVMIEKHYSHLDVEKAIEQLRGEKSRDLINLSGVIDAFYESKKAP